MGIHDYNVIRATIIRSGLIFRFGTPFAIFYQRLEASQLITKFLDLIGSATTHVIVNI